MMLAQFCVGKYGKYIPISHKKQAVDFVLFFKVLKSYILGDQYSKTSNYITSPGKHKSLQYNFKINAEGDQWSESHHGLEVNLTPAKHHKQQDQTMTEGIKENQWHKNPVL